MEPETLREKKVACSRAAGEALLQQGRALPAFIDGQKENVFEVSAQVKNPAALIVNRNVIAARARLEDARREKPIPRQIPAIFYRAQPGLLFEAKLRPICVARLLKLRQRRDGGGSVRLKGAWRFSSRRVTGCNCQGNRQGQYFRDKETGTQWAYSATKNTTQKGLEHWTKSIAALSFAFADREDGFRMRDDGNEQNSSSAQVATRQGRPIQLSSQNAKILGLCSYSITLQRKRERGLNCRKILARPTPWDAWHLGTPGTLGRLAPWDAWHFGAPDTGDELQMRKNAEPAHEGKAWEPWRRFIWGETGGLT